MNSMPSDQQVSELLLRWEELRAQGQRVAAEELCRDCPELLPEIKRRLEALWPMYDLGTVSSDTPAQADDPDATRIEPGLDRPLAFLAPAQQPDEIGRLGPYRVLKVLGTGGMGMVFQAEDSHLRRHVALKVMRPEMAATASSRQRFLREARAVAAIEHESIVPIYQAGEDGGVLFLAMQLLKGESLDERLRREGKLAPAEILQLGQEIAHGLAAAHEQGLVHRDIKPSNIWLHERPGRLGKGSRFQAKVLDFGLVRSEAAEGQLTHLGDVLGTPAYMSPEQAEGKPVDARSDLFSFGCVLYYMATGEPPFRGNNLPALLRAVTDQHPPPPNQLRPEVPTGLSDLIMRLLNKDREKRPASAREVAEALHHMEVTGASAQSAPLSAVAPPPVRRRRLRIPLLAGIGIGVVVAALVLWRPWAGIPPQPVGPAPKASPALAPLQIKDFRLLVFKETPDKLLSYALDTDPVTPRVGDFVRVKAEFSEPVYCYLLAFNPDGKEQPCWPADPHQQPERLERLDYPRMGSLFPLNDGEGLQVFVLLASRQPLPAYDDWKAQHGVKGWRKFPPKGGIVWRGDGERLEPVMHGQQRGEPVSVEGVDVLAKLSEQLRHTPGIDALAVEAFAVFPAQGEK
jgi:tRNA A-37 threonylcarbamoyl transferase component Bud32